MFGKQVRFVAQAQVQAAEMLALDPRRAHLVRFDADPNHDHAAVQRATENIEEYRRWYADVGDKEYPLRIPFARSTGLPARLNGLLSANAELASAEQARAEAESYLNQSLVSLSLYGFSWDEIKGEGWLRHADEIILRSEKSESAYPPQAHVRYQQFHMGLPVMGGMVVVHLTENTRRVSATSSYFPLIPILDMKLPEDAEQAKAKAVAIAREVLMKHVPYPKLEVPQAPTPYLGHELFILPIGGMYRPAFQVEYRPVPGGSTWRVFVDAVALSILGEPEERMLHAYETFPNSTAASANQPAAPNLTGAQLDQQIARFMRPPIDGGGAMTFANMNPSTEAANVAVHANRFFDHFTSVCGADATKLARYLRVPNDPNSEIKPGIQVTIEAPAANQNCIAMGFDPGDSSHPKQITFQMDPGQGLLTDDSRRVHAPSLDPEVVYHEFAHAFMWLLNRSPFDLHQHMIPFGRAMLEGYANYFARSFAARNDADPSLSGPDHLWAPAAYQRGDFGDENGLSRKSSVPGQDLLVQGNLYPDRATSGTPVYLVAMVWSRALWDLRGIVGADRADRVALSGYMKLLGFVTDFEMAAEAIIDGMRQLNFTQGEITDIQNIFASTRGIYAERGMQALARANGAVWAGADLGVRCLNQPVNTWSNAALASSKGVVALAVEGNALYAATETGIFKNPNPPGDPWTAVGNFYRSDGVLVNWPPQETPLCLVVAQNIVHVGTGHGVWVCDSTNANAMWQQWNPNAQGFTLFSDLVLDMVIAQLQGTDGNNYKVLMAADLTNAGQLSILTDGAGARLPAPRSWRTLSPFGAAVTQKDPCDPLQVSEIVVDPAPRIAALAFVGTTLYAGTLAHGIWRRQNVRLNPAIALDALGWEQMQPNNLPAVLRLVHDGNHTLYAGTSQGVFMHDLNSGNVNWSSLVNNPSPAIVRDLLPDGASPLVATFDRGLLVWDGISNLWREIQMR